jgi:hypothetical protein
MTQKFVQQVWDSITGASLWEGKCVAASLSLDVDAPAVNKESGFVPSSSEGDFRGNLRNFRDS